MTTGQQKIFEKIADTDAKVEKIIGILTGGNGGGVIYDVKKNTQAIGEIKSEIPNLVHEKECRAMQKEIKANNKSRWITLKDVILLIVVIISLLYGNGIIR